MESLVHNCMKPEILFLFSDTGGGHRSATEAVIEAIHLEYGDAVSTRMLDFIKQYAPRPFNYLPRMYPTMVRVPAAWGLGFRLSDRSHQRKLITSTMWPYVHRSLRRLVAQNPCDLIVSVHPLATTLILRALGNERPPFITLVTDLATVHAFWYERRVDLCLVPTDEARRRALVQGLSPQQVQVVGLPVADRFCQPPGDRSALRARFGWPDDRPMVLLMGGGEGMGPLERTAQAIANACPNVALVVIAGRNEKLKAKLEAQSWPIPVFVYGFVREMPDFMRASDILVTKAGPGTISEALNAGLPIILYSRLPGQEDGNVSYVVSEGAGVWAPQPEQIVAAVQNWVANPQARSQARAACRRLARPDAARQIAHILIEQLKVPL